MITTRTCGAITWINLESPTRDEVVAIAKEYGLHSLVTEELTTPTLRPKVDIYPDYLYLILHFPPVAYADILTPKDREIDFIIGKRFIITTHYEALDADMAFAALFEESNVFPSSHMCDTHSGFIFYKMIKNLYGHITTRIDAIQQDIKDVEEQIFHGLEHRMVREISVIGRKLLDIHISTTQHGTVLDSFKEAGGVFFGKEFSYYLSAITSEYAKMHAALQSNRETLTELRITNDSLLNTKTNSIIKTLTIMAFVTYPLALIAGIFGMNTESAPIVGMPNDFWFILGGMTIVTLTFFSVFKYKRWL